MENINFVEGISKKDTQEISHTLEKAVFIICLLSLIAVPLLFFPFLSDALEFPKQLLVFFLGVAGLLLWAVKNVLRGKFSWSRSAFDLPMLILPIIVIVSGALSPNIYAALPTEAILIVGGACLYFLFAGVPQKETAVEKIALFLSISAALIGALLVVQEAFALLAPVLKITTGLFIFNPGFNFAGSALAAALFLACVLPLSIALRKKAVMVPLMVLIAAGFLCSIAILYQNRPILLDHLSGWKIATGVLREGPKAALLGIGPGNTIDAFTAYKPTEFNASDFWNLRFGTSSNLYFSILTSFGLLGFGLLIYFAVRFILIAKSRLSLEHTDPLEKGLIASVGLILALGLVFPAPLLSLFLLFVVSGTLMSYYRLKGVSLYSKVEESTRLKFPLIGLSIALLVILIGGGFFLAKFALADYFFASSLQAAAQNKGKETYDLQIKALELNPYNSNYRISYSQTNLALANSLAGQPNLTDEQKQTVVALVQQAIREARLGAALAPQRAAAWENLSLVYRNLINFAQGASDWAVASQNQAVQLDPTNPRLRLDLGGIYFAAKDYQSAAQIFNQAVNLKPDFANAHYNLAQALKGLGQNQLAIQELQTTATLVCATANGKADCDRVNGEVTELNKTISEAAEATKSAAVVPPAPETQEPLATPGAQTSNLPKTEITPTPKVSSNSGELQQ